MRKLLCAALMVLTLPGLSQIKFKDYPNVESGAMNSNALFIISKDDVAGGTRHVSFGQLTNQMSVQITNSAQGVIALPGYSRHVRGQDLFWFWSTIQSNKPVRILCIGDSVMENNETTRGLRYALDQYMVRGGFGTACPEIVSAGSDGNLIFYAATAGGVTYTVPSSGTPSYVLGMPNASTVTSSAEVGGVLSDRLTLEYLAGPSFGSMLVETQRHGGTWATRSTIDASLGTGRVVTNFALSGYTNYNLRVTSTGTNALLAFGLLDNRNTTNSHAWAKLVKPGGLAIEILTNMWEFYTNYQPHLVLCEVKDPEVPLLTAMSWTKANLTNSDVVWITPSPNLPDSGIVASREAMVRFAQTNSTLLFDKYALFIPTNYWYPLAGIYTDGAHLGYKGIQLASSAFVDWFGVGQERFGQARLSSAVDISGKANLSGGNWFSGAQAFAGNVTATQAVIAIRGPSSSSHFQVWDPVGNAQVVRLGRRADAEVLSLRWSTASDASMFTISNNAGVTYISCDSPYGMNYGTSSRDWYWFRIGTAPGNTSTPVEWMPVKATNGATYYLPAYQ